MIGGRRLAHLRALLAWVLLGLSLVLAAGALALAAIDDRWDDAVVLVPAIAFAGVGSIVAGRLSGNPIGWLFCVVGVTLASAVFATAYAHHALVADPGSLPGSTYAALIGSNIWGIAFFAGVLILLLFPTGSPPSRRWRPLVWLQAVGVVAYCSGFFAPEMLTEPFANVENPLYIEAVPDALGGVSTAGWFILLCSLVFAAAALVVRFRRAGAVEREQIKWMASAGVFFAVTFALDAVAGDTGSALFEDVAGGLAVAGMTSIPLAAGFAILRYRLFDIDLLIRRTLVYGGVTAGLAGLYFAVVLLLQEVFSSFAGGSDLAIAGSTLAVAALFRPVRNRIQALVDRRFYRRRYDTQQTLETFSARLREEIDLGTLRGELLAVVDETMRPESLSLWLQRGRPDR